MTYFVSYSVKNLIDTSLSDSAWLPQLLNPITLIIPVIIAARLNPPRFTFFALQLSLTYQLPVRTSQSQVSIATMTQSRSRLGKVQNMQVERKIGLLDWPFRHEERAMRAAGTRYVIVGVGGGESTRVFEGGNDPQDGGDSGFSPLKSFRYKP